MLHIRVTNLNNELLHHVFIGSPSFTDNVAKCEVVSADMARNRATSVVGVIEVSANEYPTLKPIQLAERAMSFLTGSIILPKPDESDNPVPANPVTEGPTV